MEYLIRNETTKDYQSVEEITREAFWNLYIPGCNEHYLVHEMRKHKDFIPELAFVIEHKGEIIGNIMFTKAKLISKSSDEIQILTFGPLCIKKGFQRKGLGKKLMEHSFQKAKSLGYSIIVIFGNPGNYVSSGFQSCYRHSISIEGEIYPTAMLVKELSPNVLAKNKWQYIQSNVYEFDTQKAEEYDNTLPPMEKLPLVQQEEFFILSHSNINTSSI